jgi:carboxyl-terminal processing protease
MNISFIAVIVLYFTEMLFVPVVANDAIREYEFGYIKEINDSLINEEFTSLFDSLVSSGTEERTAEIYAINTVIKELDPYSKIFTPSEINNLIIQRNHYPVGVGLSIARKNDKLMVTKNILSSPAYKAGIRMGDCILSIDGKLLNNTDLDEILQLLYGELGTKINIIAAKTDGDTVAYTIKRGYLSDDKSVAQYKMITSEIGYIRLSNFQNAVATEIVAIIDTLQATGLKNLIVDVRYNTGGTVQNVVDAISLFLPKGKAVIELKKFKKAKSIKYKSSSSNPITEKIPLVVLTDRSTFSGAEIFAGVLQDWDRALLIGDSTSARGIIQHIVPLSFGYALRLTTYLCHLPSGRTFDKYFHNPDADKKTYKTRNKRRPLSQNCIIPDIILPEEYDMSVFIDLEEDVFVKHAVDILKKAKKKDEVFLFIE